jgi:hypothetical protein
LTGLDKSVLQIKTKIVRCHRADSKPVKQEVNGTVKLPPLVFPVVTYQARVFNYRQAKAAGQSINQGAHSQSFLNNVHSKALKILS